MKTRILTLTDESIAQAIEVLATGGLIAFPTDTVYGVGARAFDAVAVKRLYVAKERPRDKAIPVLLASADELPFVAREIPHVAHRLADTFWPGALTLILPRRLTLPAILTAGGDSVAVRVPDHLSICALIAESGAPLAATSANLSGLPSPITAQEAAAQLGGRVNLILDGGPCPGGVPSTVLDLTRHPPRLLRAGPVTRTALQAILPYLA